MSSGAKRLHSHTSANTNRSHFAKDQRPAFGEHLPTTQISASNAFQPYGFGSPSVPTPTVNASSRLMSRQVRQDVKEGTLDGSVKIYKVSCTEYNATGKTGDQRNA